MQAHWEAGAAYYEETDFRGYDWTTSAKTVLTGTFTAAECTARCTAAGSYSVCGGAVFEATPKSCVLLVNPNAASSPQTAGSGVSTFVRADWFNAQLSSNARLVNN